MVIGGNGQCGTGVLPHVGQTAFKGEPNYVMMQFMVASKYVTPLRLKVNQEIALCLSVPVRIHTTKSAHRLLNSFDSQSVMGVLTFYFHWKLEKKIRLSMKISISICGYVIPIF